MFQKNIVKKYIRTHLDSAKTDERYKKYRATFHNPEKIQHIQESKEEQYQEGFLRDLFCDILGYTINPEPNYNLITEKKNESDSRKADGAIIINGKVQAVIELKGCDTTDLSKVENQAFGYKAHNPTAHLVIISNFEKLRLYVEDASNFVEFNIFTMSRDSFELLYLCLGMENVKSNIAIKLKQESLSAEISITDKLYADYSAFKRALFQDICELNPSATTISTGSAPADSQAEEQVRTNKLLLFKKTQKLLDRILFVLFCEDRGLLPENSVAKIIDQWQKLKELDAYQPLYHRFQNYFNHIHTGYKSETDPSYAIFAYNGGLFKPDEILDTIRISDNVLYIHTKRLSEYDFESEVSVDILGHIFEHSLTEIEEIQEEIRNGEPGAEAQESGNRISKRKKDGVFYTPPYITKYIVENTIGRLCDGKKAELGINDETFAQKRRNKSQKASLDEKLKAYRQWLLSLKICDPACGSGAFLNAALQFLKAEHTLIDQLNARLYGDSLIFQEVENAILENNLYGVDINEESVEIAKLSLWLHTAQKGRKLTALNNNIKCGNSLIDDPAIAGEKAFCWEKEFPEVFGILGDRSKELGNRAEELRDRTEILGTNSYLLSTKKGFDVVIGNPPYVPTEFINTLEKKYYEKKYKSAYGRINIYPIFYEKGIKILKRGGLLGFITPYTLMKNQYYIEARKYILNNSNIISLVDFAGTKVFEDATVDSIVLILEKNQNINNQYEYISEIKDFNQSIYNITKIKQQCILEKTDLSLNFQNNKIDFEKLLKNTTELKKIVNFKQGIITGNNKKFIVKENLENTKKVLTGADFNRFSLCWHGDYILYLEKELHRPRTRDIFEQHEKLLLRQTGAYPICMIDTNSYYTLDTVHNGTIIDKMFNIKYILLLLNSKLLRFVYENSVNETGKVFAQVKIIYIDPLPIKNISLAEQQPFIDLAHKMLTLNADLQKSAQRFLKRVQDNLHPAKISAALENFYTIEFADFVKELSKQKVKLSLKQQDEWEEYFADYKKDCQRLAEDIATTDNQINQLVYKLYDLTDEEIAVVEGK